MAASCSAPCWSALHCASRSGSNTGSSGPGRRGRRRAPAGRAARLVDHGAGHASGRATGVRRAVGGRRRLVGAGACVLRRRDRRTRAGLQPDDRATARAARPHRAGRARRGLARTGAPAGPRTEESAVPAADHGREPAARPATSIPISSTRSSARAPPRCSPSCRICGRSSGSSATSPRCPGPNLSPWTRTPW